MLAEILGVAAPTRLASFHCVALDNGVALYFAHAESDIEAQHYAFLVTEDEFDRALGRIRARGLPWWAEPEHRHPGAIDRRDGGRGLYWDDPGGHRLEILTGPCGG